MMGLVEDQQRTGPNEVSAEPVAKIGGIFLVLDQVVRDDEPVVRPPGIDVEAALFPDAVDVGPVDDLEEQPEPGLHLFPPLEEHRRRATHDDVRDLASQEKLAGDEPRLDRLAEPHPVGDEQIDPRHAQGHAERFELVMLDLDPRAERCLQEIRSRRGHAVPAQGVIIGRESVRRIETTTAKHPPTLAFEDVRIEFLLPDHFERSSEMIGVDARESDDGSGGCNAFMDFINQVSTLPDSGDPADVLRR